MNKDVTEAANLFAKFKKDPFEFIKFMWGLSPQMIKQEYITELQTARTSQDYTSLTLEMFEPFVKGEMLTWQQAEIVYAVKLAINKRAPFKITVASGHSIGKSTVIAMILLWFLMCHLNCKIGCTAPTAKQIHDVLWAECAAWIKRMPPEFAQFYDYKAEYIRIKEAPNSWFARAATSSKENPEALAGLHADDVLLLADEASGVFEEVFESAKSALTAENVLFIMISNPTRLDGYFFKSHKQFSDQFQKLQFSSLQSPIVDNKYIETIIHEHGEDSDEFKIRVLGRFPDEDEMDDKGYLPLLLEPEVRTNNDIRFFGRKVLAVDPSGEGKDTTDWVLRDNYSAKVVCREKISSPKTIAQKTLTLCTHYGVLPGDVVVDNFGSGANVAQELALLGYRVLAINVGDTTGEYDYEERDLKDVYLNLRAKYYWNLRKWIKEGGQLCNDPQWKKELPHIYWRRNIKNRIQIMPKLEMKKKGVKSPNAADALMLTFAIDLVWAFKWAQSWMVRPTDLESY